MAIYGDIRKDIGVILRTLCEHKKVEIIEAELCPDHIHMLVSIPPNLSVSQFVGYLKGKSSLMIFDRHANLKYKYGNRHFWCRGYYIDTVGKNEKKIADGRRGLGLGLALCKSIIEAHNGTIVLTDRTPSGCCFTISLPLKEVQINE